MRPGIAAWMGAALAWGLLLPGVMARAQHGGPPGGGGGMPGVGGPPMGRGPGGYGPGGPGEFPPGRAGAPPDHAPDATSTVSTMRGGLQLGPPGRWWDDRHFAKELQLRPEQQRRMDAIFADNRASLLQRFGALQGEENRMETLIRTQPTNEPALFAEIDRVAEARAALEKANTHLLLQIRNEMDADQVARLETHREPLR